MQDVMLLRLISIKRRPIYRVLSSLYSYEAYTNVLQPVLTMTTYNDKDYRPQGSGVAWKRDMPLGPGKEHDDYMTERIDESKLYSGDGTVQNPEVSICHTISIQFIL